jgi:hypothetical protein
MKTTIALSLLGSCRTYSMSTYHCRRGGVMETFMSCLIVVSILWTSLWRF